ncbi:MAG: sigma-70 family RNA polymerase sigma factor [Clostridium sp.]|uniref:sigma-70 family RNA polymerase sigma factor n=1 Tax=Clostridium sp. TaxID=1506 RepID=UPI00305953E5
MTNEELRDFIDKYSLLILKVISSVLNKPHEKHYVEDCYSEVLFTVWNHIDEYRGDAKLKNWVATIAKNKAIDFKRKLSKGDKLLEKIVEEFSNEEEKGPDEIFQEKIDIGNFNRYIDKLNSKEREIFRLKYILELSTQEICNRELVSQEALYMRLSRIKKKLKNIILNEVEV